MNAHQWYDVGWGEWVALGSAMITLAGFLVTLGGLLIKRQKKRTAELAEHAIRQAQLQIRTKLVILYSPQLRSIANDFDKAIKANDLELVWQHLDTWREGAAYVLGILPKLTPEDRAVRKCLQRSLSLALEAGGASLKDGNPARSAWDCRDAIMSALDVLSSWIGEKATQGQPGEDE